MSIEREDAMLRELVTGTHVKGVALVLGYAPKVVQHLLDTPEVARVIYVPGREDAGDFRRVRLRTDLSPLHVQRRDLGLDYVDFLFVATGDRPWSRERTNKVRAKVREFRPSAVAYEHMQLDLASEWLGAGFTPEQIDRRVFPLFAKATGLLVKPDDAEFATRCIATARAYMGEKA